MSAPIRRRLRRLAAGEDGSQIIEMAIVFPILLLLFAGATEIGRMYHNYTTLSKGTRTAARYLSTSKNLTSSDQAVVAAEETAAKNLVLCGSKDGCGGQGQPEVSVYGLTASNITITKPAAASSATVQYVTVSITDYSYTPVVFNLSAMIGSSINFTLAPTTTMRYML